MRPVRLELAGFAAFREKTVVDFDGLDLFALVGPTGAGKSSVIDGIVFALYGSVARYKSAKLVAPVINQLSTEARIRLDFTVGDDDYTATRIVRRTAKGASTKEARLERGDEVLAGNARELDSAIEDLLGLDFDQFTKTVVLPQGEFARFLTDNAESRQALLRRLLAMERFRTMGAKARERARDATVTHDALVGQLGQREPVTASDVDAAANDVKTLERLQSALTVAVDTHRKAQDIERTLGEELESAQTNVALLRAVKTPPGITKVTQRISKLETQRDSARESAEVATLALQEAKDSLAELDPIDELNRRNDQHGEAKLLKKELGAATKTEAGTAKALAATISLDETATKDLLTSTEALEQVRLRAGAAGFVEVLAVGEACPLCSETVTAIPDHDPQTALTKAQRHFDDAQVRATAAGLEHRSAERDHDRAVIERAATQQRSEEIAVLLDGRPDAATTAAQLQEGQERLRALERAETASHAALAKLQSAQDALAEVADQVGDLRRSLTDQRDALNHLKPPVPKEESIADDWETFVSWSVDEAALAADAIKTVKTKSIAATKESEAGSKAIVSIVHEAAGAEHIDEASNDPLAWLAQAQGRAAGRLSALEQEHAAQAASLAQIDALATEASVAGELGRLLSASGFERWLMTDVMHRLGDRATERLQELSAGAYSLVTDGADFSIRDHRNADEVRSARTLSGGETFLASLALALALSENVAELATQGAPRIESMFLDEGFGTLDPETLDVVATAIEELGAQGQMIGVITHVRELAERIPARFDISRTPSGSQVVRADVTG